MKLSAEGGQAKPVAANATDFNQWKFTTIGIIPRDFLETVTLSVPLVFPGTAPKVRSARMKQSHHFCILHFDF